MFSYKPLQHILVDRELKLTNVCKAAGVSSKIATKINNNKNVNIETLAKICLYLGITFDQAIDIYVEEKE